MTNLDLQGKEPHEEGTLRACEGILRSQFGRRPFAAAARAMAQLERENRCKVQTPEEVPSGLWSQLLGLFRDHPAAWASTVAVIALGVGLSYRFAIWAPPQEIGRIAQATGTPSLQSAPGSPVRKTKIGDKVFLGDRIETGDADKAELVFRDGTILRLNYNTVINIPDAKTWNRSARRALMRPPQINLLEGQVWTKVQKLAQSPPYAIATQAATAVARGTEFGLQIKRPRSGAGSSPVTILTVKEGAVTFSNSRGSVEAPAMTQSTASADAAPSQPVPGGTIKVVELGAGKSLNVHGIASAFDHISDAYRMVYPEGWAGFWVRDFQGADSNLEVRVFRVWPGSPAEAAGIAVGDSINAINGNAMTNAASVRRMVYWQQGSTLVVDLSRGGSSRTVSLTTTMHPYAPPAAWRVPPELDEIIKDATWQLIAASAQEQISSNRWHLLAQSFQQVLGQYPGVAALHNNLAIWYDMGLLGPRFRHFKQAIAAEPNNLLYLYNLSLALADIGNFERCIEEAEKVAQVAPDWVPGVLLLGRAYGIVDRHDEGITVLKRSLSNNPANAELWSQLSSMLLWSQDHQEALRAALRATELEPSYSEYWARLSTIFWALGENAKSESAARRAIELDPGNGDYYQGLAVNVITRLGDRLPGHVMDAPPQDLDLSRWRSRPPEELAIIDEAEHLLRKAIEVSSPPEAYSTLGTILLLRGAIDEAEPILRQAMQMDPRGAGATACNSLAMFYAIWGIRLDEALELASRASQINSSPDARDTLACVHFRRGELDEAAAIWKTLAEAGNAHAWFFLGKVYERKKETASAIAAYQEALRLKPDQARARQALRELQN